jgi:hypothetical protein
MEVAERQYEIPLNQPNATWVKRVIWFCALVDFAFIAWSVGDAILHSPHQPLIHALFKPVVVGSLLVFGSFMRLQPKMTLTVGHEFVESRIRGAWFRYKKRIWRSEIKSVSENRRGIYIRDRGKFAARILGLIFIPASTPEYKEIKAVLGGWAPVQAQP